MFTRTNSQKKLISFIFYGILFLFPFLAFWQVGWMQYIMKWDILNQFFPYRYFISECFSAGILPMWNPYQHLGWPFHADPQSGFWYPIPWLLSAIIGYDSTTLHLEFMLHLGIAGTGLFHLLRGKEVAIPIAMLFALSYACCGVFVNNAQHLTWIVAMAWLPWVIHFYFRMTETFRYRYALWGALCMSLMLTGGYPAFMLITNYFFLVVFLVFIARFLMQRSYDRIKKLTLLNILFYTTWVLLSIGYLISFTQVMPHFTRGEGLTLTEALGDPLEVKALISLVFPFAVTKGSSVFTTDLSMLNVYMGLIPLLLAGMSFCFLKRFKIRVFLILGLFCLFAALGDATPIRAMLYKWFPLMDTFRFPSIFRGFFIIGFLIAGALSMQIIVNEGFIKKRQLLFGSMCLVIVCMASYAYFLPKADYFVKFPHLFNIERYFQYLHTSTVYQKIVVQSIIQFILLVLLSACFYFIKKPRVLLITLLLLGSADLFLSVQLNLPARVVSDVKQTDFQTRLAQMPSGFPIPSSNPLKENETYIEVLFPSWFNHNIFTKEVSHVGFNNFNLTRYSDFYESGALKEAVKNPLVFGEPEEAVNHLEISAFNANEIHLVVENTESVKLNYLQIYYPGWRAYVNDVPQRILSDQKPYLSIEVSEGKNSICFRYEPDYVKPAMIFSSGLMLMLFLFLIAPTKRLIKRESTNSPA